MLLEVVALVLALRVILLAFDLTSLAPRDAGRPLAAAVGTDAGGRREQALRRRVVALRTLGRLADAMDSDDGRVYADRAWEVLNLAAANGEWTPKKRLGEGQQEYERRRAEERERERDQEQFEAAVEAWRRGDV